MGVRERNNCCLVIRIINHASRILIINSCITELLNTESPMLNNTYPVEAANLFCMLAKQI